tara:strand:+ start:431 stop:631 length:201 start_codon:yes stop_codon:yes gene_type:complete
LAKILELRAGNDPCPLNKGALMTASYGLGMLLVGIIALSIASIIAYYIINKVMKQNKKPIRFDDLE